MLAMPGIAPGTASVVRQSRQGKPTIRIRHHPPFKVRRINLRTKDMGIDPGNGNVYASVQSADTTGHGNSIV